MKKPTLKGNDIIKNMRIRRERMIENMNRFLEVLDINVEQRT